MLHELTGNGEECTYEKRAAFTAEIESIKRQRIEVMDQVTQSEALLQELRQDRADLQDQIR